MTTSTERRAAPAWFAPALLGLAALACVLSGLLLADRSVDTYQLPAPGGGVTRHQRTHVEWVALQWLAWLTAALAVLGLALTLLRRELHRWWWIAVGVGTVVALNAALIAANTERPTY